MRRKRTGLAVIGVACALALAVSGCAKSSSNGDDSDLKLGLLTTLSGPSSSAFKTTKVGVDARLAVYRQEKGKCADRNISVVQADDASTAQGALTGAQKLVQQDKVYAVLPVTSYFFGAAPYMTSTAKGTPVIGAGFDGAKEWTRTDNNLFSAMPVPDFTKTYATTGLYFKSVGGTRVAALANNSPSAKLSVEANLKSSEAAGMTRGYVNTSIPFGSTDVGPIVLGIIRSKADVVLMAINPDTAFAAVAGLRQAGYKTKAVLTSTGYGADLLESAPAVQAAQGVTFLTGWAPTELKTKATERLSAAIKAQGVSSGVPAFNQSLGWLTTDLFLHALDKAGCDASQATLISTLRDDTTWNADGLYQATFDFHKAAPDKSCLYFLRLKGRAFVPEPNTPICGGIIG